MAVRLWDAHYSLEDCIPLPVSEVVSGDCISPHYKKSNLALFSARGGREGREFEEWCK